MENHSQNRGSEIEIDYADIKIGSKLTFSTEKPKYTVKAVSERYMICTRPYNPKKTVIYTIIDLKEGIRGTNNLVFNLYDYAVQADIDQCLRDLHSGEVEITRRNRIPLDLVEIDQ